MKKLYKMQYFEGEPGSFSTQHTFYSVDKYVSLISFNVQLFFPEK